MFGIEYKCDRCVESETVWECCIAQYRLHDGREISCFNQPAWCHHCKCVRNVECIPELFQIEMFLDRLTHAGITPGIRETAEVLDISPEEYFQDQIDGLIARLEWRRNRKSSPKCLQCGTSNFDVLKNDADQALDSFAHPHCGGIFRYVTSCHFSQASEEIVNSEGEWVETRDR